jgi:hypothetical protein
VTEGRRSRRDGDASARSAHVAERASALGSARVSTSTIRTHRLSEGVVAEASIVARLLRWRILTLDASVVLLPANTEATDAAIMTRRREAWRRRAATRGRISDALKSIEHAEQELARARHTNEAAAPQRRLPNPK